MNSPASTLDDDALDQAARLATSGALASATWLSIAVNVLLASTQVSVGVIARSQGLVADGIHSLSDLVSDFIVLIAGHHGKKAADEDHPYGHQRFETAASLALGALLVAVGIAMLLSAVRKLESPGTVAHVHVAALWVAAAALLAKELLFRYMLKVAKRIKSSLLAANAWHARSDAASSLVVLVGIAGNLQGYPILDPIAALIVGLLVARTGRRIAWRSLQELMDRSADAVEVDAIRGTLLETPGVRNVHDLRTRKMGDLIVVDAHIEVDADLTVEAGHDIAVAAKRRVLQHHRVLDLMTHVDPFKHPDLDHAAGAADRPSHHPSFPVSSRSAARADSTTLPQGP